MNQYRKGTKAYIDSFGGLVPCVVTEVLKHSTGKVIGHNEVKVTVTTTKCGYKYGEELILGAHKVPPRNHIVCRGYHKRITTNYEYLPE